MQADRVRGCAVAEVPVAEQAMSKSPRTIRLAAIIAETQARLLPAPDSQSALLPVLHAVQHEFGCIDDEALQVVAHALNLSRAEVHGVASFYPDFSREADSRPVLELCGAEACQARGLARVADAAQAAAGERVRIRTVYCLGLCSVGPAARVGETVHARLDPPRVAALIGSL
jgi:formate dehydrogenase subunit gamma